MLLKIAAAILFITAGTASGAAAAKKIHDDTVICRSIFALLQHISILIRTTGMDVYKLVFELKRTETLAPLQFIANLPDAFDPGTDFHYCWQKAVGSYNYGSEEKRVLLTLGNELGRSDIPGQLSVIEALQEDIAATERHRTDELHKKARLYRSVGTLFGVMAGILVI